MREPTSRRTDSSSDVKQPSWIAPKAAAAAQILADAPRSASGPSSRNETGDSGPNKSGRWSSGHATRSGSTPALRANIKAATCIGRLGWPERIARTFSTPAHIVSSEGKGCRPAKQ
ncbi:hypothetical protein D9M69_470690 [compost metagenome]